MPISSTVKATVDRVECRLDINISYMYNIMYILSECTNADYGNNSMTIMVMDKD